ncbi:MAG TPA: hypothetical protein VGN57_19120 [Pirellulaceae bacterium]|jgi:hypothetical protein|nr:hypothetical protein [Pirellulaceae bacterium]
MKPDERLPINEDPDQQEPLALPPQIQSLTREQIERLMIDCAAALDRMNNDEDQSIEGRVQDAIYLKF